MASDGPLLTFAIPTYNRVQLLDRLLATLHQQLRGEPRVELLISDNASTDATPALVAGYESRGLKVRCIRNAINLGADRNILQCYEQAAGKYVWIFSDDDLIAPGTLARVLTALDSHEYEIVAIRSYFFNGDYGEHRRFVPTPDLELTKAADLARCVHVLFTFISGIIVNKSRLTSVDHPPFESLLDTNLVQLGPFFTALNHHRKSLLIRDPLVAATGNSSVGYALYEVFGRSLARITDDWVDEMSVRRPIINGAIQRFLPAWILATRKRGVSLHVEDPHAVLRSCFGYNYRYWAFDYPIYTLPLALAKMWMLGIRAINKFDGAIGHPLLR
jgi:abequosyltransferase